MNIILFSHPEFAGHQSMPRYTKLLFEGLRKRGHDVEIWLPKPFLYRVPATAFVKKWLGYIDQYIIFPYKIRKRLNKCSPDTFYVFADHSLGPWIPLVADRPHIIHCHDFIAQSAALNKIFDNKIKWSGNKYQAFIRRGFRHGKNFISVSEKTKNDLNKFLLSKPLFSEVVYNGLTQLFSPMNPLEARKIIGKKENIDLKGGYLLHVGGNQWYKNRRGVVEIYNSWRSEYSNNLPLILVGEKADIPLLKKYNSSSFKDSIYFLTDVQDEYIRILYAGASVLLFPSFAEGFGWPIAEAMASGCPVITTNEAPMTEVGGSAAFYIPQRTKINNQFQLSEAAKVLNEVITLSDADRKIVIESGLLNSRRFDPETALNNIETIYQSIIRSYKAI